MDEINSDHDLLVRIATTLESLSKRHEEERERVAITISRVENKADAAHTRIDGVVKFHYMTLGSVGTIAIVLAVVTFILNLNGKH